MLTDLWQRDAACRHSNPDLFFPLGPSALGRVEAWAAKQICNRCPVRTDCLDWSIDTRQRTGVWGGMTEDERRQEVERRRRSGRAA